VRAWGMGLEVARTTPPPPSAEFCRQAATSLQFQCITVTANIIIMAALREPMTARGTIPSQYYIATPGVSICSAETIGRRIWFGGTTQKFFRKQTELLVVG
jgi:hypothetical protein